MVPNPARQNTITDREKAVIISTKDIHDRLEKAKLKALIEDGDQQAAMSLAKIMLNTQLEVTDFYF